MGALSTAVVPATGVLRQLDKPSSATERVAAKDVESAETLARILQELRDEVANLRRRWEPRAIVFEDIAAGTLGAKVTLPHNFGGRVRWTLVGWQSSLTNAPVLREDTAATTSNVLVLESYTAGTATIRVEEAG